MTAECGSPETNPAPPRVTPCISQSGGARAFIKRGGEVGLLRWG